jgi:signal transduction histidine kinase
MRERARLAREIHDVLGHYLTAVHVHMRAAENLLDRDRQRARGLI